MTPWLGRGTTTVHGRIDAIKGMNEFPPRASGPRRPSAVVSRERRVVSPTSALPHGPECREGPRPARALCATPPAVDAHTDSDTPRTRDCGLTVRNILSSCGSIGYRAVQDGDWENEKNRARTVRTMIELERQSPERDRVPDKQHAGCCCVLTVLLHNMFRSLHL